MSSRTNYYDFRDAKVLIAMELSKRGWEIFGFKPDESDSMTDTGVRQPGTESQQKTVMLL